MKISAAIQLLEQLAPPSLQESYDNSGTLCGDVNAEITGALLSLDCIESVVEEAINRNCNMIIAHHPILFTGLKSITGKNYVERTLLKAIKNDIVIYAIHTNLDNVFDGVNKMIARQLKLEDLRILAPKSGLIKKLNTFVPIDKLDKVRQALFDAGAGHIGNYDHCSFQVEGSGTFRALEGSNPYVGNVGVEHSEKEAQLEVIFSDYQQNAIIQALGQNHPYETVAYDIHSLDNKHQEVGSGMIGSLSEPMDEKEFLRFVSSSFASPVIRHTKLRGKAIQNVALCGGSGSFLLNQAMQNQADAFITGDFKYHEFFDADQNIVVLDIGHFESEQFTPQLILEYLEEKNVTFAVLLSQVKTNPVHYFIQ
ncbi:MAG: Nif3-like dinuclear metal center hexameric protein [Flavobacteriales bacterium]|jgi:dinuclear metal center YbgI/SA1388 family protein|nr:Nif3-like dinuclear metal center hexameric protein [Flavobacteriales bacterium]